MTLNNFEEIVNEDCYFPLYCKKQKTSRNILLTRKYLKEKNLLAIPFDKGIGFCLMKVATYQRKINEIIHLPQFEKIIPKRKNEKHPVVKEEEKVLSLLKRLKDEKKISESLFFKLKPTGSQPPRLYGLAKVHKKDIPVRPVLSMPGSAYHKVALQVAEWLSVVNECDINLSSKTIADSLGDIILEDDDVIVSFDVSSLYTNVPVQEAISDCTNLLFSGRYQQPPVDKSTFKELLTICSCDVIMLTNDGYYRQIDGLAMGSPPAPLVANGWLSKFDSVIRDNASLFSRYMDDIIREINRSRVKAKLKEINELHPSLKFTIEEEINGSISFLDMKISRVNGKLSSTWYTKPTDTGLTMNFHSLAPLKYKRSVVAGLVHRIFRSCSTWNNFHNSLEKAKSLLCNNQYPPAFYEPIIKRTLEKIVGVQPVDEEKKDEVEMEDAKLVFIEYRGKVSDNFERSLKKCNAPCKVVFTLRKVKTCLPSLKSTIDKTLRSGVVYKITCSRCDACYVGQTSRHLLSRIREHRLKSSPVGAHFISCNHVLTKDDVIILATSLKSPAHLMTLEALWIDEIKPSLNTKDEYRSRTLTIKM